MSTTGGVPYHEGPNDGVCMTASMEHRESEMEIVRVASTHFEVMGSPAVKEILCESYNEVHTELN